MRRMVISFGVLACMVVGVVPLSSAGGAERVPSPPRRLEAIPGPGVVTLSWSVPASAGDSVTAYRVYRDGARVAEVTDLSAPVHTDTGRADGDRHRYQLSAVGAGGESGLSRPVTVTVGARPEDPATGDGQESGGAEALRRGRVYTYSLATRGPITADTQHFAMHVAQTLNDPRGWSLGGSIEFRQVNRGGNFTVFLAEAGTLPSFGYPCHPSWSCRVGRNVIINQTRWLTATDSWRAGGGSLDSYRRYVVNHETGHWLGFGHSGCPGGGRPAPVMQQQSKGLNGCRHNTWPVPGERSATGGRHGVGVRPVGVAIQRSTFGRRGDRALACDWNGNGRESPGLVRGNQWRIRHNLRSGGPQKTFRYGRAGDRFVCGDWDGNGTETAGVVRGNQWLLRNSNRTGPPTIRFRLGSPGDRPLVGDWNGDGVDTAAMVDGNLWRIRNRNSTGAPFAQFRFGRASDRPVAGDWDGNGRTDPGVVRGQVWLLRRSMTGGPPQQRIEFGSASLNPIVGRWAGLANDLPGRAINGRWHFRRFAPVP